MVLTKCTLGVVVNTSPSVLWIFNFLGLVIGSFLFKSSYFLTLLLMFCTDDSTVSYSFMSIQALKCSNYQLFTTMANVSNMCIFGHIQQIYVFYLFMKLFLSYQHETTYHPSPQYCSS